MDAITNAKYLSLQDLSKFSSLSVKTLRSYLQHPEHPLPHYRMPGKILISLKDFWAWLQRYRRAQSPTLDLDREVNELAGQILTGLK